MKAITGSTYIGPNKLILKYNLKAQPFQWMGFFYEYEQQVKVSRHYFFYHRDPGSFYGGYEMWPNRL